MEQTECVAQSSPAAFSVPEFCSAHRISRAMYYLLARDGRAPRHFKVGRRRLISAEAAADWRRRMEAASSAEAA
jgi:predicted DNA-binding transcriptional regulator AlpA